MRQCLACGHNNPDEVEACLACAAALPRVCPTCGAPAPGEMRFCGQCGSRLPEAGSRLGARQEELQHSLQALMPAKLAQKITESADRLLGERRDVTVVFLDIVNFTATAHLLDSEQVYLFVDDAMRLFVDVIYKYEGTIDKFTGDGLMALFGAPVAHENDPERAVRAALDMHTVLQPLRASILKEHGVNFDVRIGVNTGLVVAGQVGSDLHMEYTVIGDTVNLAARLQTAASPGTILVSQETYQRTRPLFEYQLAGPLTVKGFPEPVSAAQPLRVLARPGRLRGLTEQPISMIGRKADLARMLGALDEVGRDGRGRMVLITGEAGLGKSRLVAEFRRAVTAPTVRIYEGSCLAYARSRPLWIVSEVLRSLLRLAEADPVQKQREALLVYLKYLGLPANDLLPYLNTVLGLPQTDPEVEMRLGLLDAAMLQRQTHAALRQVLVAEAHQAPTVLIFDDLHWVDPASRDFLEYLIQASIDVPLLLVLVSRDLERQTVIAPVLALAQKYPTRLLDIQLRPLSLEEARELIDQLLGHPNAEVGALQERIAARADGNPFFIEELIRILIERGGLVRAGETWEVPPGWEELMHEVPGTLKGLILARFDRLPDQPRRRLQLAAAVGRSFPAGLLSILNPAAPSGLAEDLALLTNRQFLGDEAFGAEAGFAFRHALVQEAVYGTLLKRDLQRLHEQIAEAIESTNFWEGDERTEVLAHHFAESRSPARAVPYLLAVAQTAARRYANQTAIQHYRRAISLMQDAPVVQPAEMTRARLGLGQSLKFMGQLGEAAGVLAEAVLDIQRWPQVGAAAGLLLLTEALRELGDVRQREGAWEDAFAHLEAALTALGENAAAAHPVLWRPLMDRMAWIRFRQGKVDEALRLARMATDGLDLKGSDDPITLASLFNTLGGVFWQQGNLAEATAYVQRSLRLYESLGYSFGMANAFTNLGVLYYVQGMWVKAVENFQRSDELRQEIGYITGRAANLQNLGLVRMALGDHDRARADLERSLTLSQQLGEAYDIVKAELGLSQLSLLQGRAEQAAAHISAGEAYGDAATPDEMVQLLWNRALIQVERGDQAGALKLAEQALETALAENQSESETDCRRVLGVLQVRAGEYAQAEGHLRESVARALAAADRYREGLALLELGRLYQRWAAAESGDKAELDHREQAVAAYHQAHELFETLGAAYDLRVAATGLQQLSGKPARPDTDRSERSRRSGGMSGGEWHPAAVLWCELEPAPGSDVEAVFETLALVLPGLRKISEAQDGYLIRRASGLTVVFGAQAVHEDDPMRAVATAVGFLQRLRRPVLKGEVLLTVRLAVSAGPVVVGPIGSSQQPELMVTGEALQMAQHLAAATPPGRLWVTQPVAEATLHRYSFHAVQQAETDLPADLTLWELEGELAHAGSARGLPGRDPQLIGRETLLEAMQGTLNALVAGQGGLIWLEGEAGIGKTRLMREFARLAAGEGAAVWQAACTAQRASHAFALIADLLWRLFDLQSTDTPAQSQARIGQVLAGWPEEAAAARPYLELLVGISPAGPAGQRLAELEPDQLRQQIHVALRTVLKGLAAKQPLVLLLDDLHWVDPLSTDLLLFLTNLIGQTPILFVCARRWDEADATDERLVKVQSMLRPSQVLRLHLDRLLETEADQLLGQLLGDDDLPLELRQFVQRRSEGNPFYIEEVVRTLIEQNYLRQQDGRWQLDMNANLRELPLPTTLGALIQSRVDTLPPELRHLLQCAAVLGGTFEEGLVAAVAEMQDVPAALTRLEARGMLRRTAQAHEWQFNHTLIENSVYNSLLKLRRRALHLKVAAALEQRWGAAASAHAAELAYHFGQASAGARALPFLTEAGEQAASRYANEEALAYFQQATQQLAQMQASASVSAHLRWRVAIGLGDVYRFVGEYSASQRALEVGLALLENSELPAVARAGVYRRLGETAQKLGEFDASLDHFSRALACLRPSPDGVSPVDTESELETAAEAARALAGMAVTHMRQGRMEPALQACQDGAAEARRADSRGDMASIENLLGGIYYQISDWENAMLHTRKAMALRAEIGHTWGVAATASNLGILASLAGDWEQARAYFERSLKLRQEMGDVEGIAIAHGNLGSLTRDQGDLAQAEAHFRSSLEMATPLKMAYHLASASNSLAGVWLQQDKLKAAEAMLAAGRAHADALGARELVCQNYRLQSDLLLARGQSEEARAAVRTAAGLAAEIGDRSQEAAAWCSLSEIELRAGQVSAADAALARAWLALKGVTSQLDSGRVSLQAGRVSQAAGNWPAAAQHYDRALSLFQGLGAQRDLADTRAAQQSLRLSEAAPSLMPSKN